MLCNKDVWAGIVALLDSGETNLVAGRDAVAATAGFLPPGFNSVSRLGRLAPRATFAGSTERFGRRRSLEYAYAVARSAGGSAPTATNAGGSLGVRLTPPTPRPKPRSSSTAARSNTSS